MEFLDTDATKSDETIKEIIILILREPIMLTKIIIPHELNQKKCGFQTIVHYGAPPKPAILARLLASRRPPPPLTSCTVPSQKGFISTPTSTQAAVCLPDMLRSLQVSSSWPSISSLDLDLSVIVVSSPPIMTSLKEGGEKQNKEAGKRGGNAQGRRKRMRTRRRKKSNTWLEDG